MCTCAMVVSVITVSVTDCAHLIVSVHICVSEVPACMSV